MDDMGGFFVEGLIIIIGLSTLVLLSQYSTAKAIKRLKKKFTRSQEIQDEAIRKTLNDADQDQHDFNHRTDQDLQELYKQIDDLDERLVNMERELKTLRSLYHTGRKGQ